MNLLDQLQPIILPEPVGLWPPAPGWWVLLALLAVIGYGLWRARVLLPKKAATDPAELPLDPLRQAALIELAQMPKPYDGAPAGAWLQQINGLLKRLCRNDYPYSQSHTLNGRKWLAFLDNRCPAAGLTRWMILVEGGYKRECKLDDKAILGLTQSVDTWIRKHV